MVNGILLKRGDGFTEVRDCNRGTEAELVQAIDDLLTQHDWGMSSEISFFDLKHSLYDRDKWTCTKTDEEHGYEYELALDSMFSSSIFRLFDYIRPHMFSVARNRDGYFGKWIDAKKPSGRDIRFVSHRTRAGDDGIGGFGNQILFEIRNYEYYDDNPVDTIYVLCRYDTSGRDDDWGHRDGFNAEKVLLTLTERLALDSYISRWY